METAPEVQLVHLPALDAQAPAPPESASVTVGPWSPVELPRSRRPSPTTIAVIAALAGVGAMALGAAAVVTAERSHERTTTVVQSQPAAAPSASERAALALLAKPSTERIAFRHAGGRLLLAVGSGGRAAILLRGLAQARPGTAYFAWILRPGAPPVRVARFTGAERAVFLPQRLGPRASVGVAARPPGTRYPAGAALVAVRS